MTKVQIPRWTGKGLIHSSKNKHIPYPYDLEQIGKLKLKRTLTQPSILLKADFVPSPTKKLNEIQEIIENLSGFPRVMMRPSNNHISVSTIRVQTIYIYITKVPKKNAQEIAHKVYICQPKTLSKKGFIPQGDFP